jgi:3-phenylpropionate/trans-cinnamate dioxygenase ferredoxin reductase subunit
VAVLGGGFIGCEVASSAIQLGKRATILEALPTLLHRALGAALGDVVAAIHRDEGVDVRTGQLVTGVQPRPGGGVRVSTADGAVDADVLVIGVGTAPNQELAEQAGLPAGDGIAVDEYFATPAPGVFAVGDVAAQYLPRYGRRVRVEHHDSAIRHGRAAARTMLGQREPFSDVHWFWSDQYQHSIQSAGIVDDTGQLIIRGSLEQRSFSAFGMDGDRLRAVISLNRPRDVLDVRRLIARDHSATADQLRDESLPLKRLVPSAATAT